VRKLRACHALGAALPSIVFVNRFYWPDESATSQLLTDLAEDLAASGWQVSVVTSDGDYRDARIRLPRRGTRNGVHIERVWTTHSGRLRFAGRAADALMFVVGAFVKLLAGSRRDVVVALTDPPMLVVPTVVATRLRGMECVAWSQDVFPDIAGGLGVLRRGGSTYRALAALARAAHASCARVVALGDRMARHLVSAGVDPARVSVVHNWTHVADIRPVPPAANPLASDLGLRNTFVVLYSGNAGRAHAFDAVIDAARSLRHDTGIVFLFVGGGPRVAELRAATRELPNVRFSDHVPRARLSELLSVASASLVTERPDVAGLVVPSKTYGILASGRPVLYVGDPQSDVAALVRQHDCGAVFDVDDSAGLAAVIRRWRDTPAERERLGAHAREASLDYDRGVATARWDSLLRDVVDQAVAAGTDGGDRSLMRGNANTAPTRSQKNAATR
jgi:colanic acid biosynthesis glycosyl transferase WcaI